MFKPRPLKSARPATAAFVLVPPSVPPPGFVPMATVTVDVSVVTVLPPASCTVTTGCVVHAVPPVPPVVGVVNASFAAAPSVMLNALLVALVSAPSVAANVYPVPILSIFKALALKLATPATAAFVNVPLNTPPGPALVPIATVTVETSVVTVLPPASCTVTTGCVAQAVPPVPPPGCVVKNNLVAAPVTSVSVPKLVEPDVTPVMTCVPELVMFPLASDVPLIGLTLIPAQVILDLLQVLPSLADTVMVIVVELGVTVCVLPPLKVRGEVPATVPTVTVTFAFVSN